MNTQQSENRRKDYLCAVASGHHTPDAICKAMKVTRSPMVAAMQRLAEDGYVEVHLCSNLVMGDDQWRVRNFYHITSAGQQWLLDKSTGNESAWRGVSSVFGARV